MNIKEVKNQESKVGSQGSGVKTQQFFSHPSSGIDWSPACRSGRLRFARWSFLLAVILLAVFWVRSAQAAVVSSTELIENPKKYDGKTVIFQGEAVGDIMRRGNYVWINVNDDSFSRRNAEEGGSLTGYNSGQSIWIRNEEAQKIVYLGSYGQAGDIIKVRGVFNRACQEHGGDMDIHGEKLEIIKRGHLITHSLKLVKVGAASGLALLTLILVTVNRTLLAKRRLES